MACFSRNRVPIDLLGCRQISGLLKLNRLGDLVGDEYHACMMEGMPHASDAKVARQRSAR